MKIEQLKTIITESVREVFRDEIKNILIEAINNNKTYLKENINNNQHKSDFNPHQNQLTPTQMRQSYTDILEDMMKGPKTGLEGEFNLNENVDPINGPLPSGQLSLDSINALLNR